MINDLSKLDRRTCICITDGKDFKNRLNTAYGEWESAGFSSEWIEGFENMWQPETSVWQLVKLLKLKRILSENVYKRKEKKIIKDWDEFHNIIQKVTASMLAEEAAFEKAGFVEGNVVYTCPICGETAIAKRNKHSSSYQRTGISCMKCKFIFK